MARSISILNLRIQAVISTHASNTLGFGHLSRSINLYLLLKNQNISSCIFLHSKDVKAISTLQEQGINYKIISSLRHEKKLLKSSPFVKFYFMDRGNSSSNFHTYTKQCLTIGIDNLGKDQSRFDILYSPLPSKEMVQANLKGAYFLWFHPSLYPYKNRSKNFSSGGKEVLLCFGGADPYDLSYYFYQFLTQYFPELKIKIVLGALYKGLLNNKKLKNPLHKIHQALSPEKLYEAIHGTDILFTAFGLTLFESLFLETPIFLINHTLYHQKLGQSVNLPTASETGKGRKSWSIPHLRDEVKSFLKNPFIPEAFLDYRHKVENINYFIESLKSLKKPLCPLCSRPSWQVRDRTERYTLYFCKKDRLLYPIYFNFIQNP